MKNLRSIEVGLVLSLLVPALAVAERGDDPPRGDRARMFLVLRLTEELGLSDEKALQVSGILRKAEQQREDLRRKREETERRMRAALDKSPPDAAALSALVAESNDIDQQMALMPENGFREIQKILSVEQQARLALFRPELQRQIRRTMQRRLEGGIGRPEPPEERPRRRGGQ